MFRAGDRVVYEGVVAYYRGWKGTIYKPGHPYPGTEYVEFDNGKREGFSQGGFRLMEPLTPFQQDLQSYIDEEMKALGHV